VKKISTKQKITAAQTVDGITSVQTRDEHAVIVQDIPDDYRDPKHNKERLNAPAIDSPLVDCQKIVPVKDVLEGAEVQVSSPPSNFTNPIGHTSTPWDYARLGTNELEKGQKIAARQELYFPPSDPSQVRIVGDKTTINFKPPVVNESSLVAENDIISVSNLWIGATVHIYYEEGAARQEIGGGVAPWPSTAFATKPLEPAWVDCIECIKANQSLCGDDPDGLSMTSSGKSVKKSMDPPTIVRPICSGSIAVTICNSIPYAPLQLILKSGPDDKQIGQQNGVNACTPVTAGGNKYLNVKDEVYAIQTVGRIRQIKSISDIVRVVDKSDPTFEIGNGEICKPCGKQEDGPTFVRDTLTKKNGPVFKAAMCGAELATVEIQSPNGALTQTVTLDEIKGQKGYFEGSWDWKTFGWNLPEDIPLEKYKVVFRIFPTGPGTEQIKYFYVRAEQCVELEARCVRDQFAQRCVERINKLRATENLNSLQRYKEKESCVDGQSKLEYGASVPHRTLGSCQENWQNICDEESSIDDVIEQCLEKRMWYKEKACHESGSTDCKSGHYKTMSNPALSKLACGFYEVPNGDIKSVQDFYY
jgi:hypothetical protein